MWRGETNLREVSKFHFSNRALTSQHDARDYAVWEASKTRTSIPDERGCRRQFRSGSTSVSLCSSLPGGNMYSNHARYIITYHRSVLRRRHAKVALNEWFCIPKIKKKSCLSTSDSTSLILCTCIIHGCQIQSAVLFPELSGEEEKKKYLTTQWVKKRRNILFKSSIITKQSNKIKCPPWKDEVNLKMQKLNTKQTHSARQQKSSSLLMVRNIFKWLESLSRRTSISDFLPKN